VARVGDPDRRPREGGVVAYWRREARSIRSSVTALGIGLLATIVAGTVLATFEVRLSGIPGLLALIPAAIGMRGSIFGALGSRLATGILTGEFSPGLARRSYLGRQVEAVAVLSVASATQAGLLAWLISIAVGLPTIPLVELVAISLVGGVVASIVLLAVVLGLARRSSRRGWSMDDVGAPVITAAGDLVTLPALVGASFLLDAGATTARAVGVLGLVLGAALAAGGFLHPDRRIRRIVRESLAVLTIAVTIDVAAGVAVEARIEQQFSTAAILIVLPAFIANCGSLGGMLASRLSSRLHLGSLQPNRWPGRLAVLDFSVTALLAAVAFTGVGVSAWTAAMLVPGVAPLPLATTVGVAALAGALAVPVLTLVAYAAATVSFRHGFDPDNHGIPIVTATMDLAGVLCLVAAVTLLQVGG